MFRRTNSFFYRPKPDIYFFPLLIGCLCLITVPTKSNRVNSHDKYQGHLTLNAAKLQTIDEQIQGQPWIGEAGVTETVARIKARSKVSSLAKDRDYPEMEAREIEREAETEEAKPRELDPESPLVSRWPLNELADKQFKAFQTLAPQSLGVNFLATDSTEKFNTLPPPDTMGAVGPTQILIHVNGRVKLFDKNGTLAGLDVAAFDFWAPQLLKGKEGVFDPRVYYDRLSGRWYLSCLTARADDPAGTLPNSILLAVSSGATITDASSFTSYRFKQDAIGTTPNVDTGGFADYDTLAVDANAVYIGFWVKSSASVFVIRKSSLSNGPSVITAFRGLGKPLIIHGVSSDVFSATEGYLIGLNYPSLGKLLIRRVVSPGGTPSLSSSIYLTVPATSDVIPQIQKGGPTNTGIASSPAIMRAQIIKNKLTGEISLWASHGTSVNSDGIAPSSGKGDRNAARWYEITDLTATTPTLKQSGTLYDPAASNSRGFIYPSLAVNGQGHMAIGCTTASAVNYPGIAVAGRLYSDPLGATQPLTIAQAGAGPFFPNGTELQRRWGDYSQTVLDPNDDMTMWTFQEYCSAQDTWAVRVAKLRSPPPPDIPNSPAIVKGEKAIIVYVTSNMPAGSGFFDTAYETNGPGYANHIAVSVSGGVTVPKVSVLDATNVQLGLSTVGVGVGPKTIVITNPDGQSTRGTVNICGATISPTSNIFPATGGTGIISITTQSGCQWTASSNVSWIKINTQSGSGSSSISYSVTSTSSGPRTGLITVAGNTFTVKQNG